MNDLPSAFLFGSATVTIATNRLRPGDAIVVRIWSWKHLRHQAFVVSRSSGGLEIRTIL